MDAECFEDEKTYTTNHLVKYQPQENRSTVQPQMTTGF